MAQQMNEATVCQYIFRPLCPSLHCNLRHFVPSGSLNGNNSNGPGMPANIEVPARPLGPVPLATQGTLAMANSFASNLGTPPPSVVDVRVALEIETLLRQLSNEDRQHVVEATARRLQSAQLASLNPPASLAPPPINYPTSNYNHPNLGVNVSTQHGSPSSAPIQPMGGPTRYPWVTISREYGMSAEQCARAPWATYQAIATFQPAMPGYRHLSYRTAPCKHFGKSGGLWCPLGNDCNYVHDMNFMWKPATRCHHTPYGVVWKRPTHCWAFVQGLCTDVSCPYVHPDHIENYVKYTPCLAWPRCRAGDRCPYKHPEPIPAFSNGNQIPVMPSMGQLPPDESYPDPRQGQPGNALVNDFNTNYHQPQALNVVNAQGQSRVIRRPPPLNLVSSNTHTARVNGLGDFAAPIPQQNHLASVPSPQIDFANYQFPPPNTLAGTTSNPATQQQILPPPAPVAQVPASQTSVAVPSPRVSAPTALMSIQEDSPWAHDLSKPGGPMAPNQRRYSVNTKRDVENVKPAGIAAAQIEESKRQSWSAGLSDARRN